MNPPSVGQPILIVGDIPGDYQPLMRDLGIAPIALARDTAKHLDPLQFQGQRPATWPVDAILGRPGRGNPIGGGR